VQPKDLKDLLDPGQFAKLFAGMVAFQSTPQGKRALREYEEKSRQIAEREKESIAVLRGVPVAADNRRFIKDFRLNGCFIDVLRNGFAWRNKTKRALTLFFSGPPGCGKTVALSWALWHSEKPGRFVYATDLEVLLGSQWGQERDESQRVMRKEILCIDELGIEQDPELLAECLIRRTNAGLVTLVSTNLSPDEVITRYLPNQGLSGRRLFSRLQAQDLAGMPWMHESALMDDLRIESEKRNA
jgi:DNA replication protein DnaC